MTTVEIQIINILQNCKNLLQKYFHNKYWNVFLFFLVWMIFVDNDNFYRQIQRKIQVRKIQKEIIYYEKQLIETKKEEKALNENNAYFEKFVREKYFLKKSNEDVFIFSPEQ